MKKVPLVIINSPTATGKTELAINLALEFGGEIISADSLQVYRYLDIGTAKPSKEQRNKVKHHMIDVVDPDEEFNAAIFAEQARIVIADLAKQRNPVFIVGGTGLYIRALLRGIIETPDVDENIRNYYRQLRDSRGKEYLYNLLQQRDADAARKINPNDSVRVIRALEVMEQTGESISAKQKKHSFADCPYKTYKIGIQVDRKELRQRIEMRTEKMIADGLLDEVKSILDRGHRDNLKPLQSLGYKQVIGFLRKEYSWGNALDLIKRDTWHYAKRQLTWFAADKEINWFGCDSLEKISKNVEKFWKENSSI
ncbi:MAG: tRNA (adenosine(37)-N6)-dimethylallyltransferase MiaA [Smithella sp.]|jgi:tRNA dimethylallyltransferase